MASLGSQGNESGPSGGLHCSCGKGPFKNEVGLRQHRSRYCTLSAAAGRAINVVVFVCPLCRKSFNLENELADHRSLPCSQVPATGKARKGNAKGSPTRPKDKCLGESGRNAPAKTLHTIPESVKGGRDEGPKTTKEEEEVSSGLGPDMPECCTQAMRRDGFRGLQLHKRQRHAAAQPST